MKQLSALEKKSLGKLLTDPPAVAQAKKSLLSILLKIGKRTIKYKIYSETKCLPVSGKPIIYAINHCEYSDTLIVTTNVRTQCHILAGKQPLDFLSSLFFWAHGAIFFDRLNKAEMTAVKEEICACLNQGIDLIWAPEGAWNLSDSLPILPMRWGIIDVARITNAQIIPFVMNYDRENMTCRVDWGEPIHGDMLNDKQAAINRLRDCMASFCWEAWARKPLIRRADVDVKAFAPQSMHLNWNTHFSIMMKRKP